MIFLKPYMQRALQNMPEGYEVVHERVTQERDLAATFTGSFMKPHKIGADVKDFYCIIRPVWITEWEQVEDL